MWTAQPLFVDIKTQKYFLKKKTVFLQPVSLCDKSKMKAMHARIYCAKFAKTLNSRVLKMGKFLSSLGDDNGRKWNKVAVIEERKLFGQVAV